MNVAASAVTGEPVAVKISHWHGLYAPALWMSLAAVVALQVAVVHVGWFQNLFDTTSIRISRVCGVSAASIAATSVGSAS